MLKMIALLGLGAAVAFTSLPAIAQTNQSAAPAASASPTVSHKSQMQHRANMSKERTRVLAHHVRHLRLKTATA
jgi:hypothetical protein